RAARRQRDDQGRERRPVRRQPGGTAAAQGGQRGPAMTDRQAELLRAIDRHAELAIAVSGGVDSMTLAYLAHRFARARVRMVHAVSPAVPPLATARVEAHAARHGWRLEVV